MTEPTYTGMFPWMGRWWIDHIDTPPAVVVRCGYRDPNSRERGCRNAIGEVKTDGERVLAMSKNEYPEVTADRIQLAAATPEELLAEIAELEAQVLRHTGNGPGDGKTVYKRIALPPEVAPLERLTYYTCRVHGEVEIDTADLAAVVRDAITNTQTPTQTYRAHRGVE